MWLIETFNSLRRMPYHYRCRGVQTRKRFVSMGDDGELGERPSVTSGARMKDSYDYRQSLASPLDQGSASLSKSQLWAILQRVRHISFNKVCFIGGNAT